MATTNGCTSIENWDDLTQNLKRLSSRAFASNESVWRQQFCQVCHAILHGQKELLFREGNDAEEKFASQLIGLITNIICVVGDTLNQDELLMKKVCKIIISYCLHHLKKKTSHLMLTMPQLVSILESLCKMQSSFTKDELLPFQCEELAAPEFLKDIKIVSPPILSGVEGIIQVSADQELGKLLTQSLLSDPTKTKIELRNELKNHNIAYLREQNGGKAMIDFSLSMKYVKEMASKYEEIINAAAPLAQIEAVSIEKLSSELRVVKEILSWSIMEPMTQERVGELAFIVQMGLKAALFVASGRYTVADSEVVLANGSSIPSESYCRKYGWKTTEYALEILEVVGKMMTASPNLSGSVVVNLQVTCVVTILKGLKNILPSNSEEGEVNSHAWKWFEGINIMLVTMTSRVILLLSSLTDELSIETSATPKVDAQADTLNLFENNSAQVRLQLLMSSLHLPSLLLDLFLAAYEKGVKLSKLCMKIEETANAEKKEAEKKQDNSSEEESSTEEGSMLGSFFQQTITNPEQKETCEEEKSAKEKQKDDVFAQSSEIFFLLASSLLDFTSKLFTICVTRGFNDEIRMAFTKQRMVTFAKLIQNDIHDKEDIAQHLTKLLCCAISDQVMDKRCLELLMSTYEICPTTSPWPTRLGKFVLPLFTRIVLIDIVEKEENKINLSYIAWKSFIQSLKNASCEPKNEKYTNVEYLQVMILFYQLLSEDKKKELFEDCANAIMLLVDLQIGSPIHLSRLLLIFDYMLHHCFENYSSQLPKQVQANVLLMENKLEIAEFFPSVYNEDDIMKKCGKQINMANHPLFFMISEGKKEIPDEKAVKSLISCEHFKYEQWYSSFVNLMSNLVVQLTNEKKNDFYSYLGVRSSFQIMWSLMKVLPVPVGFLINMKCITEVSTKQQDYLMYLHWMPRLFELSMEEIKTDINILYTSDEAKEKELREVYDSLLDISGKPSEIIMFGKKLMLLITNLYSCEKSILFMPSIISDGLVMFLWLLLKKYVVERDDPLEGCGGDLNDLLLGFIYLLKISVERSKEMIVLSGSGEAMSDDKLHFYMDILGADQPKPTPDMSSPPETTEGIHMKVLPGEFKEALLKWNQLEVEQSIQLIPALFHGIEMKAGEKNSALSIVISSCVSEVLKTHLDVNSNDALMMVGAASLKRFIRTLTDICVELLPWMHTNHIEQFEKLKAVGMSTFSGFSIDYVAAHISMHTETLTLLCLDDPGKDRIEIVGFIRMLEIIDKWMLKEFAVGGLVEENILICWLQFMCRLMDYSKTLVIFIQYFKQHTESLFFILKSTIFSSYSPKYLTETIVFFTKLLQLGEKIADSEIPSALLKIFSEEDAKLTYWVEKLIFSCENEQDGCTLLRMLINLAIQKECPLEKCLNTVIKVSSNTINNILSKKQELQLSSQFVFSNFFDVVINVATTHVETGHFLLLKNTIIWLRNCLEAWPTNSTTDASSSLNRFEECCNALINYVAKMVSTLYDHDPGKIGADEVFTKKDVFDMVDFAESQTSVATEDSVGEDSDDESLAGKVCTFTVTQRDFMNQHWYHCHTCKMSDGVGCCTVCAKICHKGHEVSYSKHGSFFCDCGAKEDGSCKAMSSSSTSVPSKPPKSIPTATSSCKPWGELTLKASGRKDQSSEPTGGHRLSAVLQGEDLYLLRLIMKDSKDQLRKLLQESCILETILLMLQQTDKDFSQEVEIIKEQMKNAKLSVKEKLSNLYTKEKECSISEELMTVVWHSQDGVFENIKLNYGGDQGQTLRQLMVAHAFHYKPMCLISSNRRQQFAITHEKGKITILQLAGLLKHQPDGILKKTAINRLFSTLMPFTVLHMTSNPMNDDFLAVSGLKDCHVLILDHSGSAPSRLALSPKLETGNFIIKCMWLPNSQTKLALLTADFVKIYDLANNETTAIHHFVPPNGKIRDLTFIECSNSTYITVMSSQGYIYTEMLNEASSTGPFYMMNVLPVEHSLVEETGQGLLNEGGASIYYSQAMKLLFFSYTKARSFIGVIDKTVTGFSKVFMINTPLSVNAPLVQWSEVAGQLGLVYCYQQNTGNILVLNIKAEKILVQEIKSSAKSAKVHSALCYHHASPLDTSPSSLNGSTTLLVMMDDGSIQAYNGNGKSDFAPAEKPFVSSSKSIEILSEKKEKSQAKSIKSKSRSSTKFPIDFFEHCEVTNDLEYGGNDILHVYNSSQVMKRLKIPGLYIANTKASGFKIEITNKDTANVIVGLRLQVGVQAMERSPQYVEILGRVTQMQTAKNRWFDVPLTRDESLLISEKNKIVVTFGPSNDPYGLSIVDSIKVYVKSKEDFGFPQNAGDNVPATADEGNTGSSTVVEVRRPCSYSEILLASLLSTVNKCFTELSVLDNPASVSSLLHISSNLLTIDPQYFGDSSIVSYQAHNLLHNLFPDDAKFYLQKDEIQISHMIEYFKKAKEDAESNSGVIDINAFELVLNIALSVGMNRAENLVRFIESKYNAMEFAKNIIDLFWKLHTFSPDTPIMNHPDAACLSNLVEMIVEILFALMLGDKDKITPMAKLIINLLLVKDLNVSSAAKQGLIKALQSRRKLTAEETQVFPSTSCAAAKESKESLKQKESATEINSSSGLSGNNTSHNNHTSHNNNTGTISTGISGGVVNVGGSSSTSIGSSTGRTSQHVQEAQDVVVEIEATMDDDDDDGIVMDENEIMSNGDLQMLLDDDSSVMEIALALSLQTHEENNVMEGDDQELPLIRDDDLDEEEEDDDDDDDDEDEEEFEDELINYDEQHEQVQDADEPDPDDGDLSDVGQECFSESSGFVAAPAILSTEKTDTAYVLLWNRLLKIFKDKIPDLLELNGFQVIPFFQVLLMLCSNLRESEEDKLILRSVVVACVEPLEIQKQNGFQVGERTTGSEVQLVLMRFLSVLMSRSNANKQSKENSENVVNSFDLHAAQLLSEFGLIDHCLFLLKSLHKYWEKQKISEDQAIVTAESTNLLKMRSLYPIPDMMPFFMEQYVKSHALDLFEAFPQLVTEMVLRVPYQIHKLIGSTPDAKYFTKDWTYVLCEYMLTPHTPLVRRQVRKLLLVLCGSKEKYRYVKDLHNLRSHLTHVRELLHHSGIVVGDAPARNIFLSYEDTVSLTENISACIDIASSRIENWQSFCKKEKAILPFLLQASYQVTDHISSKIIELINSSLTSAVKKKEKQDKKEPSSQVCTELVKHVFVQCFGNVLLSFMKYFLLESNSSQLRWKAHSLIHTIYLHITPDQQVQLVESMWSLWDTVSNYGHRASQIVDLLGYFTLNISHASFQTKIPDFIHEVITMLKEGNKCLLKHPNASLYRKLRNFVELDGFYIESDPCVICNDPEVTHNNFKLSSLKSDIRYTTTSQILKLSASHTIFKINLKISDIKRAKMVKTINLSYNNKPVPSAVELKNKPEIWQKAKKISLAQGQTDIKVELTFPITACNLMVEFVEFYDNAQFSSETLQCPRCSASVPAHPGVCSNCGENVFQCHKCRAINYDERDPFLCTSCGFCKYAKFEFILSAHPCCSVESINSEEDREKALKSINVSLEKADQYYKQLSVHREALEKLLNSASVGDSQDGVKASDNFSWNISSLTTSASQSASPQVGISSINHSIQVLAQRYCVDCKTAFDEMSKVTQTVTATRRELRQYDIKQQETLSQAIFSGPETDQLTGAVVAGSGVDRQSSMTYLPSFDIENESSGPPTSINKCYGCALSAVYHCLTLLRAFASMNDTHQLMLSQNLLQELVEHNLQQRMPNIVSLTKTLLIKLARDDRDANRSLNNIICNRIKLCLTTRAANMVMEVSLRNELSVMKESISCGNYLWEERFRCIFKLFLDSLEHTSPEVIEAITLPCLEVINSSMKNTLPDNQKKATFFGNHPVPISKPPTLPVNALKWLNQSADASLGIWKFSLKGLSKVSRTHYLMKKYGLRWIQNVRKKSIKEPQNLFSVDGWLRMLLFTPSSSETRKMICVILENLAQYPAKKQMLLHLFMSYMDELHSSGENAAEYLNLFKEMLNSSACKVFMCRFGILDKLCQLLSEEVDHLSSQESSTFGFDLAQGYALFSLAELLKSFMEDSEVKVLYRGRFVAEVLQSYLALRKLVVQRTKFIDETQEILLALLRQLTSGTEESAFMKTCIDALRKCPVNDIRTPVFIFEQLCNVIHKEEEETSEFFMLLEKDPQQEDYLQGRMQGNPYSSKEPGLSPLMRDVKNKICTECELVALLEDDTGMELLVNNKIISLDLPVDEVYRKIWCNGKGESKDPMKVIYRMRGLLGDATEDMVENLDSNKDEDVDEEHEYQRASIVVDIGGLEVILKRLSYIRDLSRAQSLVSVILKLLEYCVKVKAVRQYLHKPSVNAMKIMLATLNIALKLERDYGSASGGAAIAERVLKIMEIILHEATAYADIKQVAIPEEESQLELLLNHITISYVQSNANVLQAMMRLTSFLTFGSPDNMHTLIEHFVPFFDFDSFDKDKSSDVVLHLDCFCMIADGISTSASGSQLKDLIIEKKVIAKALDYLHSHTPPKSFRESGILDSAKWKDFLAKPSLPYILRMLAGLINGHSKTQNILATDENVELLHNLEQVSTEEKVGSLAENLMEALRESPVGKKKVAEVRRQTRNEKKMLAMAMRQKQLESLGMTITSTGHIKAKSSAAVKEMSELQEEKDQRLVCCICREGYKFYPTKVMGIYTFTSRCVLDEFENKPKRMQGYSTVSHFNVIHFDCHTEGVRHARSRDEWESAALQNGNTKCNGLLPMWGPQVSESSFATCLARHNSYLQECTGFREPTFHWTVHDVRLMLLRFAQQRSFSKETGGGGKHSNMFLLPHIVHVALYVLNTTRQRLGEEQLIKTFLDAPVESWIGTCYEVNGPLFMTVLDMFVSSLDAWNSHRIYFIKRLILLAHVRKVSAVPMNTLLSCEPKDYSVYKYVLMFYSLVNQLHLLCKSQLPSSEDWPQQMSAYLRNNADVVLKKAEKILKRFEEDVLPCESFGEFCDVEGLLGEIPDPHQFIKDVVSPYCVDSAEVFC